MSRELQGVWPAMITPIDDEDRADNEAIEQLVELFVTQELGGIYSVGSTGQWPLLQIAEREAVAERVVQCAGGRIPVMVHVGAVATSDAVHLARHAADIGADAVSAVAPIYYPTTPDQVFEHYRRIGAASDLPLYVYHLSNTNQLSLSPREYARRVLELPNIAGMKFTDHDLYTLGLIHDAAEGRLRMFSGADPLVCHAALSGAVGAIGTFFNLWGQAAQYARQALLAGDIERGRQFSSALQNAIADVIESGSIWTFMRLAMKRVYDIDIGSPRAPVGSCDQPWEESRVELLLQRVAEGAAG